MFNVKRGSRPNPKNKYQSLKDKFNYQRKDQNDLKKVGIQNEEVRI